MPVVDEAEANSHEAKANCHEAETKIALIFQPNFTILTRAAVRLKILIAINRTIQIFNRN